MNIAIVESKNGNGWAYCPLAATQLVNVLRYNDEEGFPTADAAMDHFRETQNTRNPIFKIIDKEAA